jgi:hypothetical protein
MVSINIKMTIDLLVRSYLRLHLKSSDVAISTANRIQSRNNAQAGFAVPLALGMGLVMIIVAASIIGRSQSDRATTNYQKESNRALSISEAGIIRVQSFLDRHQLLATKNLDQWSDTLNNLPSAQADCRLIDLPSAKQQAQTFQDRTWIDLDHLDRNKGRYKIVDYQYENGISKLTIAGEIDAYNTTQNTASSSLTVKMLIGSESANILPPALWASTFNLSPNQKIDGQVRAVNCPQLPVNDPDGITGIEAGNITLIDDLPSGQISADPFTPIPAPKVVPNTAIALPAITNSIRLPRVGSSDLPDPNGEYHYLVDIDSESSGYSIKLQDIDRIQIDVLSGQKVNLYLKGNVDLAGSQTVNVNPTHPNLRIYGSNQTTKLSIKDTASITAFIHAPLADARSTNGSSTNPNSGIRGAIWVKSWDSATSPNDIPIIQTGNWSDLGFSKIEQPSQLSPITDWQRSEN